MSDLDDRSASGPTQSSAGTGAPAAEELVSLSVGQTISVGTVGASLAAPELSYTPGTLLGRYVVLEEIGRGGMGVVFRAFDPDLDRPVALKLMRADKRKRGPETDRLFREAQALARLAHPNVVAVHDVGTVDDAVFLAMELVEGETLRKWFTAERGGRPWREVLAVLLAAGEGLAAAHAAGIAHRDFKPDNVLVGADGRVRVLDFGLARSTGSDEARRKSSLSISQTGASPVSARSGPGSALSIPAPSSSSPSLPPSSDDVPFLGESNAGTLASPTSGRARSLETPLTRVGARMGTPAYMAPEQHRGEPADARSDQFAFCVSLHEALFGHRPALSPTRRSRHDSTDAKVDAPAGSKVPQRIRRAIQRGLAADPNARFPSMAALLTELRRDPWAMPRRWAPVGAAVLVVGAGVWVSHKLAARNAFVCQGAEAHLAGVWDSAQRIALNDAFAKTGATFARDSARTVTAALDAYATEWARNHRAACEATHLRKEQSEATLDLRMACLDRRRGELAAQVNVFTHADGKTVEKAAVAVGSLPALASCADTESLRAAVPMPTEPAARAAVKSSLATLDEARARLAAGQGRELIPQARGALAEARRVGFRPLEAEALVVLGGLNLADGQLDEAAQHLEDGARAAYACRRDDLVARAWTDLVFVRGERQSRFPEAHRAALDGEAAVERLGDEGILRAEMLGAQSKLAFREGRYEEALALAEKSLASSVSALGENHPVVGYALLDIGNAMANRGDVEQAWTRYLRAEKILSAALGEDHPSTASVRNNLGNIAHLRGNGEEALRYFTQAGDAWQKSRGPTHQDVGTSHLNRGGALQDLGRYDEARRELEMARAIYVVAVGADHPDVALADLNIGQILVALERHQEAAPYFQRAQETFARIGHPHEAFALAGLASVHRAGKHYDLALRALEKALALRQKALGPTHPDVADTIRLISDIRFDAGAGTDALPGLAKAYALLDGKEIDPAMRARAAFSYGRVLWTTNSDRARAQRLFVEARELFVSAGEGSAEATAELDGWLAKRNL